MWIWEQPQQKAIDTLKQMVTNTPVLRYYSLHDGLTSNVMHLRLAYLTTLQKKKKKETQQNLSSFVKVSRSYVYEKVLPVNKTHQHLGPHDTLPFVLIR